MPPRAVLPRPVTEGRRQILQMELRTRFEVPEAGFVSKKFCHAGHACRILNKNGTFVSYQVKNVYGGGKFQDNS